jgi:hypothetical protein
LLSDYTTGRTADHDGGHLAIDTIASVFRCSIPSSGKGRHIIAIRFGTITITPTPSPLGPILNVVAVNGQTDFDAVDNHHDAQIPYPGSEVGHEAPNQRGFGRLE